MLTQYQYDLQVGLGWVGRSPAHSKKLYFLADVSDPSTWAYHELAPSEFHPQSRTHCLWPLFPPPQYPLR
jgi:hypothetical protein